MGRNLVAPIFAVLLAIPPAAAAEIVATRETVVETKAVFGQVETRTIVPARARIGGTIQSIAVSEGSEVAEGEVIAAVLDEKLALQRDAANAQLEAIRSQLTNATTELGRAEQLLQRGAGTQSRVDTAQTQVEVLTNQMAAADANRAVIEQQSREGEVLVCSVTAPSWCPVFPKIAAAVSDIGGMMSHAAIVAREYGLPAVVGTGNATSAIKTGDRVRVDGDTGVVTILS